MTKLDAGIEYNLKTYGFSDQLGRWLGVVDEAGFAARNAPRKAAAKSGEGHRSIVTPADQASQEIIIRRSLEIIPDARLLCEEDSEDPRVLNKERPEGILNGVTIINDPLDGTSRFAGRHPEWSVGLAKMQDGIIMKGAISAPDANGGMLAAAELGITGLFLSQNKLWDHVPLSSSKTAVGDSIILFGVDCSLYPSLTNLFPEIAANFRAKYDAGSGLFGLMQVALGDAQVIVQTPQKAWDWAPAYRLVIQSGKVFHFFRLKGGNLVPVGNYDFDAFCLFPKENRLGFVAGEPALVKNVFNKLPKSGWSRIAPDTVNGNWL